MNDMREPSAIRVSRARDLPDIELAFGTAVREPAPQQFHEQYEIGLVTAGAARFSRKGSRDVVAAGQFVLLQPGEPHAVDVPATGACSFSVLYVPVALMADAYRTLCRSRDDAYFPALAVTDRALRGAYGRLLPALERGGTLLGSQSVLGEFLVALIARHAHARSLARQPRLTRRAVDRVRDHLRSRFADEVSLDELAAEAHVSKFHLVRLFRQQVGMTPHAYQLALRLAFAKRLLREGEAPGAVAHRAGFYDHSHFAAYFRRCVGMKPEQYRRGVGRTAAIFS
jgi:AraC-like DNA-binding protein